MFRRLVHRNPPKEEEVQQRKEILRREPTTGERFAAGACAGALSRFSTAPIDRVKLLFQIQSDGGFHVPKRHADDQKIS